MQLQDRQDTLSFVAPKDHPFPVDPQEYSDLELLYGWLDVIKKPDKQGQGMMRALALGVIRSELERRGYDLSKTVRENFSRGRD